MTLFRLFSSVGYGRRASRKNRRSSTRQRAPLHIELLEDRTLLCNTISGFVYNDANGNGILDAGEKPLANSPIQLKDAAGAIVANTTTDGNGRYVFSIDPRIDTSPTTLTREVSFPETPTDWAMTKTVPQFDPKLGKLTSVDITTKDPITSTIKVENMANSAALVKATVSGTLTLKGPGISGLETELAADEVFNATEFDGTMDFGGTSGHDFGPRTARGSDSATVDDAAALAAYIGTGNVPFTVTADATSTASGSANLVLQIHTTAEAGVSVIYHYIPSNCLKAGNYSIVQTTQPTGLWDGLETRGNLVPLANTIGTDVIPVTLGSSDVGHNNFGELTPTSVAGFVYVDRNNNGIKETTESGIENVTVRLAGLNDRGQQINLTTTTGPNGGYRFTNLRPGTYRVKEDQPTGYLDGKDTLGNLGGAVGDDQLTGIVLGPGANGVNYNFGELLHGSLAGFVYVDRNHNGLKETGEAPIAGATVRLAGMNDLGEEIHLVTRTAADGSYKFADLRPGTYRIKEDQPTGYLDGKDTVGSLGGTATFDQFTTIPLGPGINGTNYNFGEINPAGLAGFVYVDSNNNGTKDAGETGIGSATVRLAGINDRGEEVHRSTLTAADGSYRFGPMRPGTYRLKEDQPSGYLDGKDTIGSLGGSTTDDQHAGIIVPIGSAGLNYNFGEVRAASLSGFVYYDKNNDGIKQAGETGIQGTKVALTGVDDLGQAVALVHEADATGLYGFPDLRPGTYILAETQPGSYFDGKDTIGTPGGTTEADRFTGIRLAGGVSGFNNNFGEVLPASLSGFVYNDVNNNGIKEAGEAGLVGIIVSLSGVNDLGQTVQIVHQTDSTGLYGFANLRPGVYAITETQPAAYLDGKETIGTPGGVTEADRFTGIKLASGVAGYNNNFGELRRELNPEPPITRTPSKRWFTASRAR